MEINYTDDWYMDCPQTEEDWDTFVTIMEKFGVSVYPAEFGQYYECVGVSWDGSKINRRNSPSGDKVDIYGAIQRLTRPIKTAKQVKIEELENTINQAKQQIEELKKEKM